MSEYVISVHLPERLAEIGWIIYRQYENYGGHPAPFEVSRFGGTPFGWYHSLDAAIDGAKLYGRRYAALPEFTSFAEALGPADAICNAYGQALPDRTPRLD